MRRTEEEKAYLYFFLADRSLLRFSGTTRMWRTQLRLCISSLSSRFSQHQPPPRCSIARPRQRAQLDYVLHHVRKRSGNRNSVYNELLASNSSGVAPPCAMSYEELNRRANRLAWHLRSTHNVGVGNCVGIFLPRSAEM